MAPQHGPRRARIAFSDAAAIERVRLLFWTSALGTIVVVAYIEV
ncbi:hypothetical protein ACFWPP_32090 [Streptomyces anulatus]